MFPKNQNPKDSAVFSRRRVSALSEHFLPLSSRGGAVAHFTRISSWSAEVGAFLSRFYGEARSFGAAVDGRIPNPDGRNLAYFGEMMGAEFSADAAFIEGALSRWLPRAGDSARRDLARSLASSLSALASSGKPPAAVRNAYVKFMCWLYYRFPRVAEGLGGERLPKVLLCGEISAHELMFVSALVSAGCDAVLVLPRGEESYRPLDPSSAVSDLFGDSGGGFPEGFSASSLGESFARGSEISRAAGGEPSFSACTNAWAAGGGFSDVRKAQAVRGASVAGGGKFFFNCFCRIDGADDRAGYESSLVAFRREMAGSRSVVVAERGIQRPTPDEIAAVRRGRTDTPLHLACDLCASLPRIPDAEADRIARREFALSVLSMAEEGGLSGGRLVSRAVSLAAISGRYFPALFGGLRLGSGELPIFVCFGAEASGAEAAFVSLLARLPCDVVVLNPTLSGNPFDDARMFVVSGAEAVQLDRFPEDGGIARAGTAAYQAERDLDEILYTGTGMFREMQHSKAEAVRLMTTFEEIRILWDEEARFRPNFSVDGGVVKVPSIFAKISGVKDGDVGAYWREVGRLCASDRAFVVRGAPLVKAGEFNPMKAFATEFYRDGVLRRERILSHRSFPYGLLRKEIQELILDKLALLLERRLVRGIGENGAEYVAVATVLNLPKEIVRLLQGFDFTARNPKLVYINAGESEISFEDAVIAQFLGLSGFDVVFFVPTGYRSVERHFPDGAVPERVIGEFECGLSVPDEFPRGERRSFLSRLLGGAKR